MKMKFRFVILFGATFLIGSFAVRMFLREPGSIRSQSPKIDLGKAEKLPRVSETDVEPEPKVFRVAGFWDELKGRENRHLIEPGDINQRIVKLKKGEIWLGLFGGDKSTSLRPTKVRIDRSGKLLDWSAITVAGKETPLFLVKDLKRVKAGNITTLFRASKWDEVEQGLPAPLKLEKGFTRHFDLGGRAYTLRVEEGRSEKNERILVLLLESESKSQIVDYIDYVGDGDYAGDLFWVGDLDSDGRLDLFMTFWNYEKGSYSSGLFLSSEAEKGRLVKRFEFLAYGGC